MTVLHYAVVFLVVALIVAVFGFGGVAVQAGDTAEVLFMVFIGLAGLTVGIGLFRRR